MLRPAGPLRLVWVAVLPDGRAEYRYRPPNGWTLVERVTARAGAAWLVRPGVALVEEGAEARGAG